MGAGLVSPSLSCHPGAGTLDRHDVDTSGGGHPCGRVLDCDFPPFVQSLLDLPSCREDRGLVEGSHLQMTLGMHPCCKHCERSGAPEVSYTCTLIHAALK